MNDEDRNMLFNTAVSLADHMDAKDRALTAKILWLLSCCFVNEGSFDEERLVLLTAAFAPRETP